MSNKNITRDDLQKLLSSLVTCLKTRIDNGLATAADLSVAAKLISDNSIVVDDANKEEKELQEAMRARRQERDKRRAAELAKVSTGELLQ